MDNKNSQTKAVQEGEPQCGGLSFSGHIRLHVPRSEGPSGAARSLEN